MRTQHVRHDVTMWWWCLVHSRVEAELGCAHQVRLGPFETEHAAEQALAVAAERNRAWDEPDEDE